MANRKVLNLPTRRIEGVVEEYNDLVDALGSTGVLPHYDRGQDLVEAADATDLATSKTLTKAISDAMVSHGANTEMHSEADAALDVPAAYSSAPSEPANLAEVGATLNELKDDLNTHLQNATPHRGVGGEGGHAPAQVTTADYNTTQAEANALANALKAAFNRHVRSGGQTLDVVSN